MNSPQQPLVSVCMIVKNEINNLDHCLKSIECLADEVVIVDTGSDDGTIDYLNERAGVNTKSIPQGDKFHSSRRATQLSFVIGHFDWCDDFSKARNHSLKLASGQWIVWLDADDIIEIEQQQKLRKMIQQAKPAGFLLRVKNTQDLGATGAVFAQLRVFPNDPEIEFTGEVHEEVYNSLVKQNYPVHDIDVRILHTGYANQEIVTEKQQRNLNILLVNHQRDPAKSSAVKLYSIGCAYQDLQSYNDAIIWYKKALKHAEKHKNNPHIQEGAPIKNIECLLELEDFQQAMSMLNQSNKRLQNHPEMIRLKAETLLKLKQPRQAKDEWLKLFYFQEGSSLLPIDFQKSHLAALLNLSEYFKAQNDHPTAQQLSLELLRAAKMIMEKQAVSFQQVFDLLFEHQAYEDALILVKFGLKQYTDVWHYVVAAHCCIKLNKLNAAKQYSKKGKKKFPDDPHVIELLKFLKLSK